MSKVLAALVASIAAMAILTLSTYPSGQAECTARYDVVVIADFRVEGVREFVSALESSLSTRGYTVYVTDASLDMLSSRLCGRVVVLVAHSTGDGRLMLHSGGGYVIIDSGVLLRRVDGDWWVLVSCVNPYGELAGLLRERGVLLYDSGPVSWPGGVVLEEVYSSVVSALSSAS